uniref:Uncharacterized protein n=1 Tax=Arundo donax TaxID=35708 RepID=A0A0A9H314_ARUDO
MEFSVKLTKAVQICATPLFVSLLTYMFFLSSLAFIIMICCIFQNCLGRSCWS